MVIDIWSAGDPCIGNSGGYAQINFPHFEDYAYSPEDMCEFREKVRGALVEAFREIFDDGAVLAVFADEVKGDMPPTRAAHAKVLSVTSH
jgi:hypothetical protein